MRLRFLLALAVYFLLAGYSSDIAALLGYPGTDGLQVITVGFFALIIICMLTERGRWPVWKRLVFVPASFVMHVVLTIPAGAMLGILKRSPDHVRTIGEQRAVFVLASLPILLYALHQSRLFVRASRAVPDESEV
jgi:hypothetical protein